MVGGLWGFQTFVARVSGLSESSSVSKSESRRDRAGMILWTHSRRFVDIVNDVYNGRSTGFIVVELASGFPL